MTSIFNLAKPPTAEMELSRVRAENQSLLEELAQCQADKEFVWSLWKRLQVATPDITQAIGMVVQREKEKAELKDQKVLEILQLKDNKIEELQQLVSSQTREVSNIHTMKLEMQGDVHRMKKENAALLEECEAYKQKVEDLEAQEHELGSRQAVREMDKEILEMKQKLSKREREVEDLIKDKDDLSCIKETQKERIGGLEDDLNKVGNKYENLARENAEAKKVIKQFEKELSAVQQEAMQKNNELETVRFELSEVWQTHSQTSDHSTQQADLIRQLRSLHQDTQLMMRNQERAFTLETNTLKGQLAEQSSVIAQLTRQVQGQEVRSHSMPPRLDADEKESQTSESDTDMEHRIQGLQTELNCLRGQMSRSSERRRPVCDRGSSPMRSGHNSLRSRSRSPSGAPRHVRSKSEPRSRPLQGNMSGALQRRLNIAEKKLDEFRELLRIKNVELEDIKMAHNRRLNRLRSLQSNYRLIKKQLKLMEEDEDKGPRKKKRKIPRADPKSLQKEDSDKVWNELTYFRNENRNLTVEKMNLEEEVDLLKVQTAQDSATIYELRSCLEQEREELEFLTEQQQQQQGNKTPVEEIELELKKAKKEVKRLQRQLQSLQEDTQAVTADRDKAMEARRDMKAQIRTLQQREGEHRIKVADLNREVARLNRELKRKRKHKGKTTMAKQYQRVLNHSIQNMRTTFDNFTHDGWEEISDTEENCLSQENTAETTASLGQVIAEQADLTLQSDISVTHPTLTSTPSPQRRSIRLRPTHREKQSLRSHTQRMCHRNESPTRDKLSRRDYSPVHRRDVALSPIHFLGAKSPSSHPSSSSGRSRSTMSVGTSPHVVSKKGGHASSNAVIRQVATLKQRIQTLQQQVALLRTSRDGATQRSHEQKDQINQLQSELSSTNQKLQSSRLLVQRLTSDLERLRGDKEILEQQMQEYSFETNTTQHTEQEWAHLQSRLKTASSEVSKQLTLIKTLKAESTDQKEKIQQLQDRVNHLDRDVTQKRTLMEDMKVKMRFAQENAQTDAEVMTEVEGKLRNLSEANSRYKTQVESFRQRLSAVSKQKYENEDKIIKLSDEIERKTKQVSTLQRKNTELQSTVVAIEKTAQQQMHALANQSELAIDTAQSKLSQANTRLQEHDKFIKVFSHALLNSLQQARSLWQQQKQRKKETVAPPVNDLDPSLRRAQSLACDILNLSQSDLDDIMSIRDGGTEEKSETAESSEDTKKDKKWSKKLEKSALSKTEFALILTQLFMEKIEERNKLAAKLQVL